MHCLITWPTGTGKTWTARQEAAEVLSSGGRVLVCVPLKALAAELELEWGAALPGVTVRAFTSDTRARAYQDAQVLILTPERLDLISRAWRRHHHWLAAARLLIADEVHLLADPVRGPRLDGAVTRLRATYPLLRVMALSATVGDPETLRAWLGAAHLADRPRRTPLHWHARTVAAARHKPAALLDALRSRPGPTLIFTHARRRADALAADLTDRGVPARAHHAGLSAPSREAAEAAFRRGDIQALVATPTLELGVNLPCEHAVLYDLTRWEGARALPLSRVSAWQRAGRAGRHAGGPPGQVTVIGTAQERPERYATPDFEPLRSALGAEAAAQDFLLGSVAGGYGRTEAQLARLAAQTFAAFTGAFQVQGAVSALIEQGGLSRDDHGRLSVTPLGQVAARCLLPVHVVAGARDVTDEDAPFDVLLRAIQAGGAAQLGVPGLEAWTARAALDATLAGVPSALLDAGTSPSPEVCCGAALLHGSCHNTDAEVADAFGVYPGAVAALRDATLRIVEAWAAWRPGQLRLRLVAAMLRAQTDLDGATLSLLRGVGPAHLRALRQAGVPNLDALAGADPAELAASVGAGRADRWVTEARVLLSTLGAVGREAPARPDRAARRYAVGSEVDPVRLVRATFLTVTPAASGVTVTGGAQAHAVQGDRCDCPDHRRTRLCKHVLAARLAAGDLELRALASSVSAGY